MFRKHISFLASIICLAVLTSCLQSGNETPVTSAYKDETTAPDTDFDESDTPYDTTETYNSTILTETDQSVDNARELQQLQLYEIIMDS